MENFCYWQEDSPNIDNQIYKINQQKICLLRLNEYKMDKEVGIKNTNSIFCPYSNKEDGLSCLDYFLIKDLK